MKESFIQIFNQDGDPLFVELATGKSYWMLPYVLIKSSQHSSLSRYNFHCVKYLSHLDDRGQPYFEDMSTNEVSWALPSEPIMSNDARSIAISLQLMNRSEAEDALGQEYNEDLAIEQMNELDLFFDNIDKHGDSVGIYNTMTVCDAENKNGHVSISDAGDDTSIYDQQYNTLPSTPSSHKDRHIDHEDSGNSTTPPLSSSRL